ncbi:MULTISPECIES: response regulator [Rufibacter]|uniref:CheY-like chemotaxis protein n=1 Tax=Rufibacter quisquiliarum TaxID=1549639 RepID=A0A839GLJ5_9BACT|nr:MULTISPECIES: response regulator [Rufibacter]MBA9076455.1 CheY-like chemotaxis protein [Rufibacter quisquiliarum]
MPALKKINSPGATVDVGEILVIDDDTSSLYLIQDLFQSMGMGSKVTTATSASEALKVLKERAGTAKFPELILLDIRMPEEDGFGFLEKMGKLKLTGPVEPKVVVLSYYGSRTYQERASRLGVAAYLLKPLTKEKVLDFISLN